jgi:hypothetical protein
VKRDVVIDGDIARVPLTLGYEAVIDAADVPLVVGYDWSVMRSKGKRYARRNHWTKDKQTTILLHRVIAGAAVGAHVDHEDGDGLNCRRNNLRSATHQQNCMNSRMRSTNRSGFKGVNKHTLCNKFVAQICTRGVRQYLGLFNTAEEAHAAYCRASAEQHQAFGRTA